MEKPLVKSNFVIQDIARFRTQLYDTLIGPHGLTTSQAAVLSTLFVRDEQIQSELAATLKVGSVTLGGLVDRLEAAGLVERRAMPGDRRANRVCLTPAAYPLGRIMDQRAAELKDLTFVDMSVEEVEVFSDMLERVRENLLAALGRAKNASGN
jgi:MarR family transcriptional regulator for hemolysin